MKIGDKFYHQGSWNTESGWWEITRAEVDCGMVMAKPLDHPSERESEWFANYAEKAVAAVATGEWKRKEDPEARSTVER